jgi:long-chain acyl-CoA synthetase
MCASPGSAAGCSLGLADGDRVAGLALNSFRHLEAWFAIPTANLIFNDLNFRLALPELEFIVNDSGASVLCADARHWETAELRARCPRSAGSSGWIPDRPRRLDSRGTSSASTSRPGAATLDADCVGGITYTGGTTGTPEGCDADARRLMANAKHMLWANPLFEQDRFLHLTPMFHSAGVANMYALTLVAGTHVTCPGFDADLVGRMIEEHRITVAVLVPTMINMFLNHPGTAERDLSSWRLCLYAASPMPVPLLQRAMAELPCGFSQGYGMTEMCPHVSQLTSDDHVLAANGDPMRSAGSRARAPRASASTSRSAVTTARAARSARSARSRFAART